MAEHRAEPDEYRPLSRGNNLFVTADPAGASPLLANATNAGPPQTFLWSDNGDSTISLRAVVNNMDVTAESAGALPLINNRINTGPWETFTVATVPPKITASLSNSHVTLACTANYLGWIMQTNLVGLRANGAWGAQVVTCTSDRFGKRRYLFARCAKL